ncbi:hypothetical protein OSC52_11995 [Clostridium pasteurianum]|nr:hypothetical protein [Clostridium pasteurianum]UZW12577.1 hypothetical protein OSC52_11995 [Clostridium pasteurianum]
MPSAVIRAAEDICKKLKIEVKPVNTKQDIVNSKNFSATVVSTRKTVIIK